MIVLDASAATDLLLRSDVGALIDLIEESGGAAAPELFDIEVLSALRRLEAWGTASTVRATTAAARLSQLPVERKRHDALLPRIWELRFQIATQDAAYVALAERFDVELLTTDQRLA